MLGKGNAAKIRAAMSNLLDRCRAHLDLVGFGPREMATLDINDSGDIARQIAFEHSRPDIEWGRLQERRRFGPAMAPEPAPPLQVREGKLLDMWARKLREELQASSAPVLIKLEGSLDPARAAEIAGRTCTLKRYVIVYQTWRLGLQEAKLLSPPGRPVDLVDYLLIRRDEPCGRSILV